MRRSGGTKFASVKDLAPPLKTTTKMHRDNKDDFTPVAPGAHGLFATALYQMLRLTGMFKPRLVSLLGGLRPPQTPALAAGRRVWWLAAAGQSDNNNNH